MKNNRKLPVGNQSFEKLRTEGCIYVDKTDLIYQMATEGTQYLLVRPRQFSKTLLLTTFRAYFEGKKELFKGLAIEKLETEWKSYPVLYMDFSAIDFHTPGSFDKAMDTFLRSWEEKYGLVQTTDHPSSRFSEIITGVAAKTGRRLVLLVDEYDKPLLETEEGDKREAIRSTIKGFFGNLKGMGEYFKFVLVTGSSPIAKLSIYSDVNHFHNISTHREYATISGFTQKELETVFLPEIDALAAKEGMTREACVDKLRQLYDGYLFNARKERVYNPFQLINVFRTGAFGNCWYDAGSLPALLNLVKDRKSLYWITAENEIETGGSTLSCAFEDNENPLTLLFDSGYLTIDRSESLYDQYVLRFPYDGIRYGVLNTLIPYITGGVFTNREELEIDEMFGDLKAGDTKAFLQRLQGKLSSLAWPEGRAAQYEAKDLFRSFLGLIILLMGQLTRTGKDMESLHIECAVETPEHVYLFAFKAGDLMEEAFEQMERNESAKPYAGDSRTLHKIGATFSTEKHAITDWREVTG